MAIGLFSMLLCGAHTYEFTVTGYISGFNAIQMPHVKNTTTNGEKAWGTESAKMIEKAKRWGKGGEKKKDQ